MYRHRGAGVKSRRRRKKLSDNLPKQKMAKGANILKTRQLSSISAYVSTLPMFNKLDMMFDCGSFFVSQCVLRWWHINYFMASPVSYDLQGQGGGIVLSTAATTYTGKIRWIQVVNDAVLATVASSSGNITGASRLQSINLPAGLGIGGNFSQVILTSGVAIVYYS